MESLIAPNTNLFCLLIFATGCALAIYGVVQAIALLDKPSGWYCHLRGLMLIAVFVLSAAGLGDAVFNLRAPGAVGSAAALASGVLYTMFARQLRANALRRQARRSGETMAAGASR